MVRVLVRKQALVLFLVKVLVRARFLVQAQVLEGLAMRMATRTNSNTKAWSASWTRSWSRSRYRSGSWSLYRAYSWS